MKQFATEYSMSWEYIAGFFDGEGCIYRATKKGKVLNHYRLTITQVNTEVLYTIKQFLQDNNIVSRIHERQHLQSPRCRTTTMLVIDNYQNTLPFLNNILPHLIVKKDKAMEAISVLDDSTKWNGRDKTMRYRDTILEMREEHLTYKEIRDLLGVSIGSIWRVAHHD